MRVEDEQPFSVIQLVVGFFLGMFVGLGCFVISVAIVPLIGQHDLLIPMLNLVLLTGAAVFAIRNAHDRGLSRGMLISLSLLFIFNVICGVSMIRS